MALFKAAILGVSRPARSATASSECGSIRLRVKMWVKMQSVLTHIISMSTWFAAPQIADKLSPVDSFSIFRHSLEKTNV